MIPPQLRVLVGIVLAVQLVGAVEWDNLNIRFYLPYDIPLTATEAQKDGWVPAGQTDMNLKHYMRNGDIGLSLLYEQNDNIAGIRYGIAAHGVDSIAKKNNAPFLYDYEKNPMYTKQIKTALFKEDFWYFDMLFISPDVLKNGGRPGCLTKGKDEVALGVYVKLDGSWIEISRDEDGVTAQGFVKQNCLPSRGQTYFYKLSSKSECSTIQGFMVGYDEGRLLFAGYAAFGADLAKRTYIERPSPAEGMLMFSDVPTCFYEMAGQYGALCSHVYFKSYAKAIHCNC